MQGVLHAGFLFLEFGFASRPDVDLGHASGEFGQTLLKLFAIVVGVGVFNFATNEIDAILDGLGRSCPFDDGAVVGSDLDFFRLAELADGNVIQFDAEILHDRFRPGQGRNVLEHGLASIAIPRGLDRRHLQHAAKLVDDQGAQGFAGDILGNDEQRLLAAHHLFQKRNEFLGGVDFFFADQDQRLVEFNLHVIRIGDKVGAEKAAIKLHAFDDIDVGFETLGLLDGDDPVLADLIEGAGHDFSDGGVVVRRYARDGGDASGDIRYGSRHRFNLSDHARDALVHATHEGIGIHS